ncbi:MAG: hypothetical protein HYV23_05940, partial [Deltaproteobacteria bacterium]|nr:hypothetical protein [Deltaproteobacteria bacterium]
PSSAQKIWESLGLEKNIGEAGFEAATVWGNTLSGSKVKKMPPLYPRLQ